MNLNRVSCKKGDYKIKGCQRCNLERVQKTRALADKIYDKITLIEGIKELYIELELPTANLANVVLVSFYYNKKKYYLRNYYNVDSDANIYSALKLFTFGGNVPVDSDERHPIRQILIKNGLLKV